MAFQGWFDTPGGFALQQSNNSAYKQAHPNSTIENTAPNIAGQVTLPSSTVNNSSYNIASDKDFWEWFKNSYAGDEDYKRQLDLMEREQAFSAKEAQKLRDWQEGLSNTAIRRAVSDAKAAGLNPYVVLHSAQQASTPGGAAAQSGTRSSVQSGANTARLLSALLTSVGEIIGKFAGRTRISKYYFSY